MKMKSLAVGAIAVIALLGATKACNSTDAPSSGGGSSNVAAPATAPTTEATTTTIATTTTTAPPPKVVLSMTGQGIKQSANFTVTHSQWTIAYRYDCSGYYGGSGNFQVYLYSGSGALVDLPLNELGSGGNSSTVLHGAGTYYLKVNSECSWSLNVTG